MARGSVTRNREESEYFNRLGPGALRATPGNPGSEQLSPDAGTVGLVHVADECEPWPSFGVAPAGCRYVGEVARPGPCEVHGDYRKTLGVSQRLEVSNVLW